MHKLLHICIYNGPTLSNLEDLSSLSYKKSNFMTFNPFEFFKRIKLGGSWSLYRSHHVIKVHEAPIDLITKLTVVWCNANKATVKTKRTKCKSNFYIYIYIYMIINLLVIIISIIIIMSQCLSHVINDLKILMPVHYCRQLWIIDISPRVFE